MQEQQARKDYALVPRPDPGTSSGISEEAADLAGLRAPSRLASGEPLARSRYSIAELILQPQELLAEISALEKHFPGAKAQMGNFIGAARNSEYAALFHTLCRSSAACHELVTLHGSGGTPGSASLKIQALGTVNLFADLIVNDVILAEEFALALERDGKCPAHILDALEKHYESNGYLTSIAARLGGESAGEASSAERMYLKGALEPYFLLSRGISRGFWAKLADRMCSQPEGFEGVKDSRFTRRERNLLLSMAFSGKDISPDGPQLTEDISAPLALIFATYHFDQQRLLGELAKFLAAAPSLSDREYYFVFENIMNMPHASILAGKAVSSLLAEQLGHVQWKLKEITASDALPICFEALKCVQKISDPVLWDANRELYASLKQTRLVSGLYEEATINDVASALDNMHRARLREIDPKAYEALFPTPAPPDFPKKLNPELKAIVKREFADSQRLSCEITRWLDTQPALTERELAFLATLLETGTTASKPCDFEMAKIIDATLPNRKWSKSNGFNLLTHNTVQFARAIDCVREIGDVRLFQEALAAIVSCAELPINGKQPTKYRGDVAETLRQLHRRKLAELEPEAYAQVYGEKPGHLKLRYTPIFSPLRKSKIRKSK